MNVQEYYFLNNGKKFQHVEVKKSKIKTTLLYYIYSWCNNLIYTKHILNRYTKCFVYVYAVPRRSLYLLIFWFSVSTIWTPSIHLTAPTQPSHQCHQCELRHGSLTGPNWSLRPYLSAVALELFLTEQSGLNLSKKNKHKQQTKPLLSHPSLLNLLPWLSWAPDGVESTTLTVACPTQPPPTSPPKPEAIIHLVHWAPGSFSFFLLLSCFQLSPFTQDTLPPPSRPTSSASGLSRAQRNL